VLDVRAAAQTFTFINVDSAPVPSLLRGYSAPVKLSFDWRDSELAFLMANDSDAFARWEAGQAYAERLMKGLLADQAAGRALQLPAGFVEALRAVLKDHTADPAFKALMLSLPSEADILEMVDAADPGHIHSVREFVLNGLAQALRGEWHEAYDLNQTRSYQPADGGRRSLKNLALAMLTRLSDAWPLEAAEKQCLEADNMTDQMGAMLALRDRDVAERENCYLSFASRWQGDALVMDKFFSLVASSQLPGVLEHVKAAMQHPAFNLKNPNKARALLGSFGRNMLHFHAADGSGYAFLADQVLALDAINPQVASRIVSLFNRRQKLEPQRQALMTRELQRILAKDGLSKDVYEIVSKNLAA